MTHFDKTSPSPNDIHHWKAVDLSFSDLRAKINFFQPSDRQNFANALGQNCIHDLRLRLMYICVEKRSPELYRICNVLFFKTGTTSPPPPTFYKLYKKKTNVFTVGSPLVQLLLRLKLTDFFHFFFKKKGIVQSLGPAIISITNVPTHPNLSLTSL